MKKSVICLLSMFSLGASCIRTPDGSIECAPRAETWYHISQEEKASIPYRGNDTLKFKVSGSSSFSLSFYGKGRDSTYYLSSTGTSMDCPDNLYQYRESHVTQYTSPSYTVPLTYKHYIPNYYTANSEVRFNFKLVDFDVSLNYHKFPSDNVKIFDSMVIDGTTYYKVKKIHPNDGLSRDDTNYTAFYNKTHGILRMIFKNGEIWDRVP